MPRRQIEVSEAQRETIGMLCKRMGASGYVIVSVDPRFSRSVLDVIALPKTAPCNFVFIRPEHDGSVSIRPFCAHVLYRNLRRNLEKWRDYVPTRIHWRSRSLFFVSDKKLFWYMRVSPEGRELLRDFGIAAC